MTRFMLAATLLSFSSVAAAPPPPRKALPSPAGPACLVVEGGAEVFHIWQDASGRPIHMTHGYVNDPPSEAFTWSYDARGFLEKKEGLWAKTGKDPDVYYQTFRYGKHGELVEDVHVNVRGATTTAYAWNGVFHRDAVAPSYARGMTPELIHYVNRHLLPGPEGNESYDPPAFTGTVTTADGRSSYTYDHAAGTLDANRGHYKFSKRRIVEGDKVVIEEANHARHRGSVYTSPDDS
jgi:hypothetical protein